MGEGETVVEIIVGMQFGVFGVRLESHFLKGYRRAVGRGAIAVARPARPARWEWFSDLMPVIEDVAVRHDQRRRLADFDRTERRRNTEDLGRGEFTH